MPALMHPAVREKLQSGLVIPAMPLALNAERKLDERRQRALIRYYKSAGAGGIAVGVHTTQFQIRDPKIGLFKPVVELAMEEIAKAGEPSRYQSLGLEMGPVVDRSESGRGLPQSKSSARSSNESVVAIGGICGDTEQAWLEATVLKDADYDAGLLSLGALKDAEEDDLITHARTVGEVIPLIGFYLQPAAGGRVLSYSFWRRFAELEAVVAIKIAPFNRYQTIDVIRAVVESGRDDIALYTGNDDNIIPDLLTPFQFRRGEKFKMRRIEGGLLGQWAVGTQRAVKLVETLQGGRGIPLSFPLSVLTRSTEITDFNAAMFDADNGFAGCIAGIHEVLRRQGLLEGIWCLDPNEGLSRGQMEEIDRVCRVYPHLLDDEFIREHLDQWLRA